MSSIFISSSTFNSEDKWEDFCIELKHQQTWSSYNHHQISGGPVFNMMVSNASLYIYVLMQHKFHGVNIINRTWKTWRINSTYPHIKATSHTSQGLYTISKGPWFSSKDCTTSMVGEFAAWVPLGGELDTTSCRPWNIIHIVACRNPSWLSSIKFFGPFNLHLLVWIELRQSWPFFCTNWKINLKKN